MDREIFRGQAFGAPSRPQAFRHGLVIVTSLRNLHLARRVTPCPPSFLRSRFGLLILLRPRRRDCASYRFAAVRLRRYAPRMDCPSAKSCLTSFPSGWPRPVGSSSPSTAWNRAKTNSAAQVLAMPCLAAMTFNHDRLVWRCRLCLLVPDHLHAIVAFPPEPVLQTTVKKWKRRRAIS